VKIRAARIQTDIPAVTRLINPYENTPVTEEQVRGWFLNTTPGRITLRLAAVDEHDAILGYGLVNHEAVSPQHHFYVWLVVEPSMRCRGIGSALWEALLAFLHEQGVERLASEVGEADDPGLAFAEQRGFRIDRHLFHSTLDLEMFDQAPYLPAMAALEARGMRFCSLADFPDSPETRRRLYELNLTNVLEIPGVTNSPWTFSDFEKFVIEAPWFDRAGQLLAVDGDQWIGLAAVSLNLETHSAYNEHTGVLRAYRGRNVAQVLKVMAARHARDRGARTLGTHNDSLNAPILAINRKMGYQPHPGKFLLVRDLAEEGEQHWPKV